MHGILIIDKPEGITSHDVVARVRRILKTKRVGHTGTLDPFATGVMVILVGKATRLAQFLDKDEKEYEAVLRFGFETDTGDKTGTSKPHDVMPETEIITRLNAVAWPELLGKFLGRSDQTPPMYSAKKIDGKRLYEHARKGETVERKPVPINISKLELIESRGIEIVIRAACSAGTYVRTLAEDIARAAGLRAHLAGLRRTRAGRFQIAEAVTLDRLAESDDPASAMRPIEIAVEHLPQFVLREDRVEKTRIGMSTRTFDKAFAPEQPIRMTSQNGDLIAIGFYDENENSVRPKVVLV